MAEAGRVVQAEQIRLRQSYHSKRWQLGMWFPIQHHEKHDGCKAREAEKGSGLSPIHFFFYEILEVGCLGKSPQAHET